MDLTYPSLCQMTLPAAPQYQLEHTYQAGSLKTSTWVDPCDGTEVLRVSDFDIDVATGLPSASRDVAGVATSFVYDATGRLESVRPAGGAWTRFEYRLPTTSDPNVLPRVTVQDCPNGQTTCAGPLSWQRQVFDGLGRRTNELRQVPETGGVQVKERDFAYDAMGWPTSATTWHAQGAASPPATRFEDYDRFGRARRIVPPGSPAVKVVYEGERTATREVQVRLAGGTQQPAFTTEVADDHGRLVTVCENRATAWSGSCAGGQRTDYRYDVGSRLTRVCQQPSGASCGQTREFLYDQRGLLTAERHPEIGAAGNGRTFYTYDALGNVLTKDLDGTEKFDLGFAYDPASRLIRVEEPDPFAPGSTRLLKEFFYARKNFRYEGIDGRISARQTRFSFNGQTFAFQTGFETDAQGNLSAIDYPQCLHAPCAGETPARRVTYGHTRGFLTSVPGYADALTYQAGGSLHQVEHANGVDYTFELNPADGLERPFQISTSAGWSTGTYGYDGAGNVHRIGTQDFRYDRLSRMVSGEVLTGAQTHTQTATFDAYGNLIQLVNDGSAQSIPVNAATNRITLAGSSYDEGGNLTRLAAGGEVFAYEYDGVGAMKHLQSNTDLARIFIYNAGDERIAVFDCVNGDCTTQGSSETWTIRGLDGRVLRQWRHPWGQGWEWKRDYVYRDGVLLAAVEPDGQGGEDTYHLHPDHLGTPRQITNETARRWRFTPTTRSAGRSPASARTTCR